MHYIHLIATELNGIEKKIPSDWNLETKNQTKETKNQLNLRVQRKEDGILKTELAILQKRSKENNFILYLRFKHLKSTVFVKTLSYVRQWEMEWMIRLISAASCRHVEAGSVFFSFALLLQKEERQYTMLCLSLNSSPQRMHGSGNDC